MTFKAFITKYALTQGIIELEVNVSTLSPNMVCEVGCSLGRYYHGEGREWHRTMVSAINQAIKMKHDRIQSLEKQLAKLKEMTFP